MRYGGFTDPFEVQVAIYREAKKQTELLEQIASALRPQEDSKPKRGRPRKEGGKDASA